MIYEKVFLKLVPSKDDAQLTSNEYQEELQKFCKQFRENTKINPTYFSMDNVSGGGGLFGEFVLYKIAASILTVAVRSWLNGHLGRKIRIKVSETETEIEVGTLKELEAAIPMAIKLQEKHSKSEKKLQVL
jgi:hypothetical protein